MYVCSNPRCGGMFPPHLLAAAEASFARAHAAAGRPPGPVVLACGACRTLHVRTPDGAALRPLTPAERFRLELAHEATLRAVETVAVPAGGVAVFPSCGGAG